MRIAGLRTPDGPRVGIGVGDLVVRADALGLDAGPVALAAMPPAERERWQVAADARAAAGPDGDVVRRLDDTALGPPVWPVPKMICLALNYRAHAQEGGFTPPARPVIFLKGPNTLTGHGCDVVVPPLTRRIDHEGELAVVIGRRSRHLTGSTWRDAVAGYTICNDLTARDLQLEDIEARHPWDLSKSIDGYGPIGPWLVTADEIADPQALTLEVRVDGKVRQRGGTDQMIFGVGELLVRLSAVMTLEPGDVIATGTPDGIGPVPDGSTVEVRIGGLGVLRNRVVFAPAVPPSAGLAGAGEPVPAGV
ncbi:MULTISPECIES: fumarylacetoacetate hydrolase family protein [unclassified Micromonospora]|uniref:fumarylacetoacetate hydrolase family protein n=1 Tax=unclassified Micromonospora TaxID=2617518 RepID=UPI00331E554A